MNIHIFTYGVNVLTIRAISAYKEIRYFNISSLNEISFRYFHALTGPEVTRYHCGRPVCSEWVGKVKQALKEVWKKKEKERKITQSALNVIHRSNRMRHPGFIPKHTL